MKRHNHDLSNTHLASAQLGKLYPIGLQEVLPGDTFKHRSNVFLRMSPLVAPVMHPLVMRVHHFYVPNRLVWDEWTDFITGKTTVNPFPVVNLPGASASADTLLDYMGLPIVSAAGNAEVSALPVRAFNLIWNEYFRDQELQTERGEDDLDIPRVSWEKDYFTTARPDPQRGTEVSLPLGGDAPVLGLGKLNQTFPTASQVVYESDGTASTYVNAAQFNSGNNNTTFYAEEDPNNAGYPNFRADLSTATAATVNEVRRAFALQRIAEKLSRFGDRYPEWLKSFFGVSSSDARIQRPEFLGSSRKVINISEVLSTAEINNFPIGAMAGHGVGLSTDNGYTKFFEEHGHVITCVSVRPAPMYQDGADRLWLRRDPLDFYNRELELIGQQEVLKGEVFLGVDETVNAETWGYSDRYREYKETPSKVVGAFRDGGIYNAWSFARKFPSLPALNDTFIECDPVTTPFADQTPDVDQVLLYVSNKCYAKRIVKKFTTPKIF